MRILSVATTSAPFVGGIEVMLAEVLPRLVARGHDVTLVSSREQPDLAEHEVVDGVSIHRLDMVGALQQRSPARILRTQRALADIRRRVAPDVVNLQDVGPAAWFELGSRPAHEAPTVVTLQTEIPIGEVGDDSTTLRVLTTAAWVTAVSNATLAWGRGLVPFERGSVIPNAITLGESDVVPGEVPTFVAAGRLVEQKGFDVAIEAMGRVVAEHPTARLLIAGDGIERPALERLVHDLDLAGSVRLLGIIDRDGMSDLLAGAHAVVMPSRFEGMPLVALEAAYQGRPIVASRVSGVPEIVVDGVTGLLVEPDDPIALADALVHVITDHDRAEAMGAAARAHIGDRFTLEGVVDAYEQTFARVVEERASAAVLPPHRSQ
jgi:glycosyltransferase involved in cell wall biosynthesis